jgi:hypothetical protein
MLLCIYKVITFAKTKPMEQQPHNKMLFPDWENKEYKGDLMLRIDEYGLLVGRSPRSIQDMLAKGTHLPGVRKVLGSGHARLLVVSKEYFTSLSAAH